MPSITLLTQQTDREHYSWPYVTRRLGFLKYLPVSGASVLELCEVLSDIPSFLEWRIADRRGLCSNDAVTASVFCGVWTVLTLPPSFLTVEPVSSKLFTHVIMAWPEVLYCFDESRISCEIHVGQQRSYLVLITWFYGKSTLCTSPRLHFKLNAIHGHTTWQHHSPSPLMQKIEKRHCQIARFTDGPVLNEDNNNQIDLQERIKNANKTYFMLQKFFKN